MRGHVLSMCEVPGTTLEKKCHCPGEPFGNALLEDVEEMVVRLREETFQTT